MSILERRHELFRNVVRLRRAARALPGNEDIAAVRSALERELGDTLSQRLAGRILGVTHTALERWIKAGDLPVVCSASGRPEIPVPALLDLYEAVEADRAERPRRYALAPTMERNRAAADRMRLAPSDGSDGEDPGHERARARSLAYHQTLARRLRRSMVDEARYVLFRRREHGQIDDRYADRWDELLARPLAEIKRALVDEGPDADDLRQNSPFAGLLSEPERRRIVREVR
jgi:hypothetical protein